jgi:hypothetical protein
MTLLAINSAGAITSTPATRCDDGNESTDLTSITLLDFAENTLITLGITDWRRRRDLRERFGKAEGQYEGHEFDKEIEAPKPDVVSRATIEYMRDNILSIKLTELRFRNHKGENYEWSGQITRELEQFGSIAWTYTNLDNKHRFGFKRCIVREDPGMVWVYLVGEDGFEKEILVRSKSPS